MKRSTLAHFCAVLFVLPLALLGQTATDVKGNKNTPTGRDSLSQRTAGHPSEVPPTLSAVSPSSGGRGEMVVTMLTGTNFTDGTTKVNFSGTGIVVNSVKCVSETQVQVNLTVSSVEMMG